MQTDNTYDSYLEWKKWGKIQSGKTWQKQYFEKELDKADFASLDTVLEVGFGNGEFMLWAREKGIDVVGVEIIHELVARSKTQSFEAHLWNVAESDGNDSPLKGRKFDCIIAFDVIEHLSIKQALNALTHFANLLNPDGKIILRFPNGESPFSMLIYNNDQTHRTLFTRRKLQHLCLGTGLEVERYANSARVMNRNWLLPVKWLCFRIRDLCELVLGYVYYNHRVPLDQCATAVLKLK